MITAMLDNKMNKVVYIPAYFAPIGKEKIVKIPTGEKTKGLFGEKEVCRKEKRWVQTGHSDCKIDGQRLARDLDEAIKKLNELGYEIVSITSVMSGEYKYEHKNDHAWAANSGYGWGYGYGYGFSYTDSLIVVAKKITT